MEALEKKLVEDIEAFREIGRKFMNKELTVAEFKGISGGMGAYAHRGGKELMMRFRVPSGLLTLDQVDHIYSLIEQYKLETVHLTTRQAIQLHGLSIDEICDIMIGSIDKKLYSKGSGGNFPRNTTISPLSGVEVGEAFDVTPFGLLVNNYFLERVYAYKLPRKLKVSFSSKEEDEGHATIADLGFLAVIVNGEKKFKLYIGGGLGRNPVKALELDELIDPTEVLFYADGVLKFFAENGNFENRGRARLRYLVADLGREVFLEKVKGYIQKSKEDKSLEINLEELAKKYPEVTVTNLTEEDKIEKEPTHRRVIKQKQAGLYSVYLHPIGGNLTKEGFKVVLDTLKANENSELRLTMNESLYVRNLKLSAAEEFAKATQNMGAESKVSESVACIGVPTCQIGILNSQGLLHSILNTLEENKYDLDILPKFNISGCPNSCGAHEIGEIGFVGKMKRVNNVTINAFEVSIGGGLGLKTTELGAALGDIEEGTIPAFVIELYDVLKDANKGWKQYIKENKEDFLALVEKYKV